MSPFYEGKYAVNHKFVWWDEFIACCDWLTLRLWNGVRGIC